MSIDTTSVPPPTLDVVLLAALRGVIAIRPANWDDEEDPEQANAWKTADAAVAMAEEIETANAVRARCAERVRKIVLEVLNIHAADARRQLADDASLTDQWKADSLDLVDITMSVEDEFDISIPDAVAEKIDSIAATVEHILKGKAS